MCESARQSTAQVTMDGQLKFEFNLEQSLQIN